MFLRRTMGFLIPVLTAALLVTVPTQAARAATLTNSGCYGAIQTPITRGYNLGGLTVEMPSRVIQRAPCYTTQAQVVTVRYRLWGGLPGNWVLYQSPQWKVTLQPGYQTTIPVYRIGSLYRNISVDVLVEWRTTGGAFIGSRYLNYNAVADYSCASCFVRTDPTVGAYLSLGW